MGCTIVLGCYRSGTSAVAGVLHHLGIHMGERFQPPNAKNPQGYYEDLDFMECHVHMLDGIDVEHRYETLIRSKEMLYTDWGVKDPRLCYLLPKLVEKLHCEHRVISVSRPRLKICQSVARSIGFTEPETFMPLIEKMLESKERNLQQYKGSIMEISFDRLLGHPEESVEAIAKFVSKPVHQSAINHIERRHPLPIVDHHEPIVGFHEEYEPFDSEPSEVPDEPPYPFRDS